MKNYTPYARSDVSRSQVDALVEWLGVDELLAKVRQLPPEAEFYILLDFLVEFSGGLELAEHRMTETFLWTLLRAGWRALSIASKTRSRGPSTSGIITVRREPS